MLPWWSILYPLIVALFVTGLLLFYIGGDPDVTNSNEIFAGILTASAAILAISFSLTQYTISRISEQYSPYLLTLYSNSILHKVSFFLFFIVVGGSAFSLAADLNYSNTVMLIYLNVFGFAIALAFFTKNFLGIMLISNPLQFAKELTRLVTERIAQKVDNFQLIDDHKIENLIVSMSDAAVKAIERNEVTIANEYVNELVNTFEKFFELKKNKERYFGNEDLNLNNKELIHHPIKIILFHFQRIFKKAYEKEEYEITKEIIRGIDRIVEKTISEKRADYVVDLLINNQREHPLFLELQKIVSKDESDRNEKKDLLSSFFRAIIECRKQENLGTKYLEKFVPHGLFNIVKIMIESNDFESFKNFTERSTVWFNNDPATQIFDLRQDCKKFYSEGEFRRTDFNFRINCSRNIELCRPYLESTLNDTRHKSENGIDNKEEFNNFQQKIWKLYGDSLVFLATFWIGSYLVFLEEPYAKWLNQFWNVTYSDKNVMGWTNRPLISESNTWNTNLELYKNYSMISITFEPFRDSLLHIEKFYLMTIITNEDDYDFPKPNEIKELFQNNEHRIISEWYSLSNKILEHKIDERLELEEDYVNSILRISNFKDKARKNFGFIQQDAENCKSVIQSFIEIDSLQKEEIAKLVQQNYEKQSEIEDISNVSMVSNAKNFSTFSSPVQIPRHDFAGFLGSNYFEEFAKQVAMNLLTFEKEKVVDSIKKMKISPMKWKFEELENKIRKEVISKKPDLIICSHKTRKALVNLLEGKEIINIDGNRIKIVIGKLLKDEIYLLKKENISTNFKNYQNQRYVLGIYISEEDPSLVKIHPLMRCNVKIKNEKDISKIKILDYDDRIRVNFQL